MRFMRKHILWYLKYAGIGFRAENVKQMKTLDDLKNIVKKCGLG